MSYQPGDEVEWCDPDQVEFFHPDSSPFPPVWRHGVVLPPDPMGLDYVNVDTGTGNYLLPDCYVRSAPRLPLEGV